MLAPGFALGQGVTETLALHGDPTPDGTATFLVFDAPLRINSVGQVAFVADLLQDGGVQEGVFRADRGAPLVEIARTGDPTGGGVFDDFLNPHLNNAGQVAFRALLSGTPGGSTDNRGFYIGSGSAVTEAARNGQPLALSEPLVGVQDPRFAGLDELPFTEEPAQNDSGRVAFTSRVAGCEPIIGGCTPVDFDAVLTFSSGTHQILARQGDPAPVAGGGTSGTFDLFIGTPPLEIDTALINNSGYVVFRSITGDPSDPSSTEGLYSARRGLVSTTRRAIARTGQTLLPGSPGVIDIDASNARPVDLNAAGEVAFQANVGIADYATYRWNPQEAAEPGAHGLTEIARSGRISPDGVGTLGIPAGRGPQMNAGGQVAFVSTIVSLLGFGDQGVFRGDGEDLELIARFAQPTPDGQLEFRDFLTGSAINDAGQMAFGARLQDGGGQLAGDGLFVFDGRDLIEVTRSGRPLAGSTVDSISFTNVYGFNNSGQLAYGATLADGRKGIFVFLLADSDGDGFSDGADTCPFFAQASLADTDGDGRGDECECTDQNGDGRNDVSDLVAINLAIFDPVLVTPFCDGNNDGLCNVSDIIAANQEIFSPGNTSTCARQPVPGP